MSDEQQRKPLCVRQVFFDIEARAAGDDRVPIVISTDAVVDVSDGPEVLVHAPEAVDLSRAPLPIIATHRGNQINVGLAEDVRPVDGKLRGMARFGERDEAVQYKRDVLNGIIRSVSVGYARLKSVLRSDGVLLTKRWMPTHVAMVAEPADIGAGFYRSQEVDRLTFEMEVEPRIVSQPAAPAASVRSIAVSDQTNAAAGANAEVKPVAAAASVPAQPRQGPSGFEIEQARVRAIDNLCKANKIDTPVRDHWVNSGVDLEGVANDILRIVEERSKTTARPASALGLSQREAQKFSLMRAIQAASANNWTQAGYELECSREIAKRTNKVLDPNKFYVPFEVQQRDLTAGTGSAGGFLVGTQNMSFIELMRNRSVVYRMGAQRLSGLSGNVTIPRQTAAATGYWLATEGTAITESQQTFGQLSLTPKTVGAYTEVSRQLMLQSSPDAESIVSTDLATVCALAIDVGALRGSGSGGEPAGIVGTSGVGAVTGTSLAAAGVLEFQSDVAGGNLLTEACGYVTTPAVAALLMARPELPSTGTTRLWQGNMLEGTLFNMRAMSSNQMSAGTMLFGDFSKLVIAEWNTLEVEVNPYANFQAGIVGVRAMVTVDVGVRYGGAFSYAASVT
jgi:HK97 family phage major capsid protein